MLNLFSTPKVLNVARLLGVHVQVLRTWDTIFILSVGCTYGYSHSSPSGLRSMDI